MYKQQDKSADVIYYNGKIYTMDQNMTIVQSFAVKGQYLIDTGTFDEMKQYGNSDTKYVNLDRACVIPGLIEGHTHLLKFGEVSMQIDCFWKQKEEIFQ